MTIKGGLAGSEPAATRDSSDVVPRTWRVERHLGSAATFHGLELRNPVRRLVWWFEVVRPAIVLGSTQHADVVDSSRAEAAGVEVVRRRSGGGAVWLASGAVTWVDVVLPAGDPRWVDDVGRATEWLGRAWVGALEDLGRVGGEVHDGPLVRSPHSGLVCFAGLAPGEVLLDGRKVVGISQRRTRAGARFQCAVLHQWDPRPMVDLLALREGERESLVADLALAATGIGDVPPAEVVAALIARLRSQA